MDFYDCLEFGEKYQKLFVKIIKANDYKIMTGYFKEYDIIINKYDEIFNENIPILYEIKADNVAYKFNNFCIEFECSKKPSGISTTTSDYYGYFIIYPSGNYDLYIIPVYQIKKVIEDKKYKFIKKGGDRKASKFYLIDFSIFSKYKFIL